VWGALHDGTIEAVHGAVPGDVTLKVDLECVLEHLPTKASYLLVCLQECSLFRFRSFKDESRSTADLRKIAAEQLEILSASNADGCVSVLCESGELLAAYVAVELALAEGTRISLEDLNEAAQRSVDQWARRNRGAE
jgi:hypothetical protein